MDYLGTNTTRAG